MSNNSNDKGLSNSFSTGGGGVTFEQLVGASYLVSLLAGDIPRGLDWGITKEVKFQHRWSGCLLDDIVITGTDGNSERKLALQVKHDLTFSDSTSNTIFAKVIDDCWKTFNSSLGWQFNKNIDRIGIGIGIYQKKIAEHFQPLLELARTSGDSVEFLRKVSLPTFSSKEKQEYLQIVKNLLSKSKGNNITDDEIWKFLSCFVVIHFDLENTGSRDSIHCWNRLLDQLKKRDEGQAKLLFTKLTSIVAGYSRSAGSVDASALRNNIPNSIFLKEHQDFISDLNFLRGFSNNFLDSIRNTIGEKVHLPRIELANKIEASIKENDIVVLLGEPMVGKSVLLKQLANRLRSEGEIIAFSVERLSGTTIENFLHNLNIQNEIKSILFAAGVAPLRCILIDGLERTRDEDKRRVLNDLIIQIRKYNESILAGNGHRDNCWKIVFTCRQQEADEVLLHLETRRYLSEKSLEKVNVSSLSDKEIEDVINQLPKLKYLASEGHLKDILSRPLILDILTHPDISLPIKEVPPLLTETWLLDWFWKEVIRLADELRFGKGKPDKREQLLISIAMQSLSGKNSVEVSNDMDSEAISGLVFDRILIRKDNNIRFSHDVYEDWTLAIQLNYHKDDVPKFLEQINEPLHLVRAFRLHASRLLEVEQSSSAWLNLLTKLESNNKISPRWHQIALTAPLLSPLLKEILPGIQPLLLENNAALLSKFLKALRTISVQPNPLTYDLFSGLLEAELEKYLAYLTIPIWKQWIPVIQLILQNVDKLSDECLLEVSYIAEKWMTNTTGNEIFREEIAELCLELLNSKASKTSLRYEEEKKMRKNLVKSVLWAADCLPEIVDDFIKKKALRNGKNYGFEELILEEGWIPICKHLPKTAVNIIEAILCEKLEPDSYGSYHHLFMNLGIGFTKWNPPTYLKGPFLGLLRLHPDEGLNLIHRVTNHATQCWKMREELEWNRKPIPQTIKLSNGPINVWGDERVFCWYRYPSVAEDAVTCSLMSLEYWMIEQLKSGGDPQELFEKVLKNTESVAILGVCASVALANEKICRKVVIPILENPVFWIMDNYRYAEDMKAESSINMFSRHFSFGNDENDYKILLNLAKEPHRKLSIVDFVLPILLSESEDARQRLQNAMQAFPDNPPFLYEDEKENVSLIQKRGENCRIWAAQAEKKNYEIFKTGVEGQIGVQFKLPAELEEQEKEKLRFFEKQNKIYGLLGWSMNLLDKGEIGKTFTIESAMECAQNLVRQDNYLDLYQPKNFLEFSEQSANAVAAFVAALVIHQWQWIEKNNYISWCRKQLLIAAKRPEPPMQFHDEVSIYPMGYRRSAARALPIEEIQLAI